MLSLMLLSLLALDTTDPRSIMEAVEGRDTGTSQSARMQITIADAAGRERTRTVQTRSLRVDDATHQLLLFEAPADLRNAGLLSVDFDDGAQTDDQWLYLPSVGSSTRVASGDKSGSFMGTDLSYADLTRKDPDAYRYELLESVEIDGRAAWLIEATPTTDKEKRETGYLKSHVWVDQERLVVLRTKSWVLAGKRIKYTAFSDWTDHDGVWVAHTVSVKTMQGGQLESRSVLQLTSVALNDASVTAADFTEQRLERGL